MGEKPPPSAQIEHFRGYDEGAIYYSRIQLLVGEHLSALLVFSSSSGVAEFGSTSGP